jgi:hypothetical protein
MALAGTAAAAAAGGGFVVGCGFVFVFKNAVEFGGSGGWATAVGVEVGGGGVGEVGVVVGAEMIWLLLRWVGGWWEGLLGVWC